jgi:hypothetical protein
MNVLELIEMLKDMPLDALVMMPEGDGGAPTLVRSVQMHKPVYSDQPNPFVWIED